MEFILAIAFVAVIGFLLINSSKKKPTAPTVQEVAAAAEKVVETVVAEVKKETDAVKKTAANKAKAVAAAKTAKANRKMKTIELQMKKLRLELDMQKQSAVKTTTNTGPAAAGVIEDAQGRVLSRNELMDLLKRDVVSSEN